jgi:hypothetical protein
MLEFFKRLFGSKPAESAPAPYKVENTVPQIAEFPFPTVTPAKTEKKPAAKKSAAKKTARKPKAPKA